ncbi:hypothetical protein GCM10022237_10320 [Nocardioides ginsengisoli]|uniref:Uncharacterized protein n=1 Tax=Nocardioides ginsengisoli TaxID=363868 RepID=A0ABW3W8B1_9ACTN
MFDLRVFLVAAIVASPAVFRAADGTLPMDEALTRLLLVMVGATAVSMLVRAVWPILAGPMPEPMPAAEPETAPLLFAEPEDGELVDGLDLFSPRPE